MAVMVSEGKPLSLSQCRRVYRVRVCVGRDHARIQSVSVCEAGEMLAGFDVVQYSRMSDDRQSKNIQHDSVVMV